MVNLGLEMEVAEKVLSLSQKCGWVSETLLLIWINFNPNMDKLLYAQ